MIFDAILAMAGLIAGYSLRFGNLGELPVLTGFMGEKILVFTLVILFSCHFCGLYNKQRNYSNLESFSRRAVSIVVAFFILSVIYYLIPHLFFGRGLLSMSLLFFLLFGAFFQLLAKISGVAPSFNQKILILGTGRLAQTIEDTFATSNGYYTFLGFVSPEGEEAKVSPEKIIGKMEDIEAIVEQKKPHTIVVSVADIYEKLPIHKLLRCKLNGVIIIDSPTFYEKLTGKLLIENIQPSWFVFSEGFQLTLTMRFFKRIHDIVFAILGLCVSVLLLPLLAVAIKIDSPGPIFFRQSRAGKNEESFTLYKLRTMRQNAEEKSGPVWASENDSRITRVGKFLRKMRLDELPQLYNVLKGDMSVVGPRPERPEFVDLLTEKIPFYAKRQFVKPGITGWAQIRYRYGASEDDALEKLRYDLYYLKNYSFVLDIFILLETIKVVLFQRGGR
jgi:sugar transferase (PEP-CTERM system associated)